MNTLQAEVLDLVHLSHTASCDEANDEKALTEDVARSGPVCGFEGRWVLIGSLAAVCCGALAKIYGCFFEETGGWGLERASSTGIFDEPGFDGPFELNILAANLIQKGGPVPGLDCQRGIEKLLDQLLLISHNPHSNKRCNRRMYAEAVQSSCSLNRHGRNVAQSKSSSRRKK
jgi:hypothetical protein